MTAKLADFGLATSETESTYVCGTPHWMAPEFWLLKQLSPEGGPYDNKIDVYAFAVFVWEIFNCKIPYGTPDAEKIPQIVLKGGRPNDTYAGAPTRHPHADNCPPDIQVHLVAAPAYACFFGFLFCPSVLSARPVSASQQLLREAWHQDPKQRPPFSDIVKRLRR